MIVGNMKDTDLNRRIRAVRDRRREGYRCKVNRFNFVIFKNYDGSVEGKLIPRETYNRIIKDEQA